MARPKKADAEKRDDQINPRLTSGERAWIEETARALGLSASEFMRRRTLGYRLPEAIAAQKGRASLAMAFNRLGVNMNQIAHHLNAGGTPSEVETELLALIEQVRAELASLYNGPGSHQGGPEL